MEKIFSDYISWVTETSGRWEHKGNYSLKSRLDELKNAKKSRYSIVYSDDKEGLQLRVIIQDHQGRDFSLNLVEGTPYFGIRYEGYKKGVLIPGCLDIGYDYEGVLDDFTFQEPNCEIAILRALGCDTDWVFATSGNNQEFTYNPLILDRRYPGGSNYYMLSQLPHNRHGLRVESLVKGYPITKMMGLEFRVRNHLDLPSIYQNMLVPQATGWERVFRQVSSSIAAISE